MLFRSRFRGADWQSTLRGFLDTMFVPADDPQRKQRIIDQMFSTPRHVMLSCWDSLIAADTAASLSACKVPLMFIGATNPPADLPRLRELCPSVVIAQTAGAGHFHQLEVPEQVNAMIERFLKASGIASA